MTARVVWFCDVDGVLPPIRPRSTAYLRPVYVGGHEKTVYVDQVVVSRIADLIDAHLVDFRWLTTWGDRARTVLAPRLDFVGTTVAEEPRGLPVSVWWKDDVIAHHRTLDPDGPVIWTDDEIALDADIVTSDPDMLAIAPDHRVGLTLDDLDRIEAYARQHAAAAS